MKWIVVVTVSFLLGILLTAIVCREIRRADRVAYMSDIAAPTAQVVAEINADIRNGETNRAVAKLRLLEEKYIDFLNGGPRPEVFISDIRDV